MELLFLALTDVWWTFSATGLWASLWLLTGLWAVELVWLLARWVLDARETWPDYTAGVFFYSSRLMWCGDPSEYIPEPWLGHNTGDSDVTEYFLWTLVYCAVFACMALTWPIVVAIAAVFGALFAVRGGFRLRRLVWAAMKELKKKAEKDHNHDGTYTKS